ncbi:PAS modulated sigma54 specific transcriptional regulator, Fis family [Spirochaeta thermophila DSM 6578]|uniref:PAS modulated sigma54 specific transcriptional regulator, Fis family n=1 Tax=Winmispira thermophila (strain ATCC 700085 / DSM 6578 / Z-1203) TaxID=869211 RepID=G0GAL8_WINT7|nr:sigma-54-dependent Fis family transcriptional regulator [Spirochaeta thermophila]AEJ60983.1 PAS modulated sigma54 specific transcriptional regulator, Fis family [Spirochaeta thermophila DSM 6578]
MGRSMSDERFRYTDRGVGFTFDTLELLDTLPDGLFVVDESWRVVYFNETAAEITGVSREEAEGRPCWEVFRSSMCEGACPLREAMRRGVPVRERTGYIVSAEGERIPVVVSSRMVLQGEGRMKWGVELFRPVRGGGADGADPAGDDLLARSPAMKPVLELLPEVARTEAVVLITGETGTGKEVVARAIHRMSQRKDGPFVPVHCAGLPESLLEAELFGYKKGAFTGADRDKPGRFSLARGGTLFLDEIGELPLHLQVKLLRVLQDRAYEPVGGVRPEKLDARIIAATNRNLEEEVKAGRFRDDLYYRLNVVRIHLPPLRDRKEDVLLLAETFLARFNRAYERGIRGFSPEVVDVFLLYSWPGNVRELQHVVERAVIVCHEEFIQVGHLPEELVREAGGAEETAYGGLRTEQERVERRRILEALAASGGSVKEAARLLGVHRSTLYRKMQRLGIRQER